MSDAVDLDFKKEDCHAAIAKPSAEDKRQSYQAERENHETALELVEYLISHDDESPLISVLADKIEAYEQSAPEFAEWNARIAALLKSVALLRIIMDQHGLNQSDFGEEIGGKSLG